MKREVKVLGLSYSQSQVGSYVCVLSEERGKRKLPVIVKPQDAQTIALRIEGMKSPRPMSHDIIKTISDAFQLDCAEVYIFQVLEGIFYAKVRMNNGVDDADIETSSRSRDFFKGSAVAEAINHKDGFVWFKTDEKNI